MPGSLGVLACPYEVVGAAPYRGSAGEELMVVPTPGEAVRQSINAPLGGLCTDAVRVGDGALHIAERVHGDKIIQPVTQGESRVVRRAEVTVRIPVDRVWPPRAIGPGRRERGVHRVLMLVMLR